MDAAPTDNPVSDTEQPGDGSGRDADGSAAAKPISPALVKLGSALSKPDGSPTPPAYFIYIFGSLSWLINALHGTATNVGFPQLLGLGQPGPAIGRLGLTAASGGCLCAFHCLRCALRPGGELEQMSTIAVSDGIRKRLGRWSVVYSVVGTLMLFGPMTTHLPGLAGRGLQPTPARNRLGALSGMMAGAFLGPVVIIFTYSLQVAAALCDAHLSRLMDAEDDIKAHAEDTGTNAWSTKILEPTLRLAKKTFPAMTGGFGTATGVLAAGFSLLGLANVLRQFTVDRSDPNAHQNDLKSILGVCAILAIPLLISNVPASTSSRCDEFVEKLNEIRMANIETHSRVFPLLDTLKSANGGQGESRVPPLLRTLFCTLVSR